MRVGRRYTGGAGSAARMTRSCSSSASRTTRRATTCGSCSGIGRCTARCTGGSHNIGISAGVPVVPVARRCCISRAMRSAPCFAILFAAVSVASPATLAAQRADSTAQLGLGASSSIVLYGGVGRMKHAALGPEFGGALDLGFIGTRRVRVGIGIDYLAMVIDRSDSLGVRERGNGYVFTVFADATLLPSLARRVSPYGGVGFGVDAVGTTISNEQIGALYNTNVFDLHAQVGALYRVEPRG